MTSTMGQSADGLDLRHGLEIGRAEIPAARVAEAASQAAVARSAEDPVTRKGWERRYSALLLGADSAAGLIATAVAFLIRPAVGRGPAPSGYVGDRVSYPELAVLSLAAWLAMLALSGAYWGKHVATDDRDYLIPVVSALRLLAAVTIASYIFRADLSRLMVLTYFATLIVSVVLGRGSVNLVLRQYRRRGRAQARVLLVGEQRPLRAFADHLLARPDHSFKVVAVCSTGPASGLDIRGLTLPVLGAPDDVLEAARQAAADAVVVTNPSGFSTLTLQEVSWEFERRRIDLMLAPDAVALAGPRLKVSALRGLPVIKVDHPEHDSVLRSAHYLMSRLAALVLLLVASPLLLAVAVAVKLGSPGPVLYRQKRIGYKGKEFEMLKFRSMVTDAEAMLPDLLALNEHDGALFKMKNDPRITKVGRVLRKYSLDELPQLINVVKGDMALVGPRPCLAREMTMFGEAEHRRFMVRPGMTGLWQVSGGSQMAWNDAVKTDLYYVDHWTPALDFRILLQTARVVLSGSGC